MTRRRIEAGIGRAVGLVGASVLLAGCLSPKQDPTRFYVLSTSDASRVDEAWDGRPGSIDVGVGPFTMPGYLDRPQFVRRVGPNEVVPVEAARWAETLSEGFERVLAEDLDALLPMARVHAHPWRSSTRAQWIISGYVTKFETDESGEAVLDVTWRVLGPDRTPTKVGARSVLRSQGTGQSVDAEVATMSDVLNRFAVMLADTLQTLKPAEQHDR
ncbi:MAG: membrane integrity-associated transporter subunit PqiC [Gemmatimonadetes bacterium]|nr:membrane integrity-associated transporter subunit PqiC [Gemmatimonadota bacterium]